MNITLFGATGGTGREVVTQALAAGHHVTAYVRSPEKMGLQHGRLTVIQGQMDEPAKIAQAIGATDVVISALGPTANKPGRPLTAGMQHIVAAMQQHGVQRLIATTGAGVSDPNDRPGVIHRLIGLALKTFARHVLDDSLGMVDVIRNSNLTWTIARAPRLTDGESAGGALKVGYIGEGPGTQLTRADYARFLLSQIDNKRWHNAMPALSN